MDWREAKEIRDGETLWDAFRRVVAERDEAIRGGQTMWLWLRDHVPAWARDLARIWPEFKVENE